MIAQYSKFSNKDKKQKEVKAIIVILVENKVKKHLKTKIEWYIATSNRRERKRISTSIMSSEINTKLQKVYY